MILSHNAIFFITGTVTNPAETNPVTNTKTSPVTNKGTDNKFATVKLGLVLGLVAIIRNVPL